jgi:precorrin-6Y C5,15-methyltransferase (decarboxylating)
VFIGGGATVVLDAAVRALRAGGRLVVNAVTVETEALLLQRRATLGGELSRIAIARLEPMGGRHGWRPALPLTQWVWIKP